MRARRGDGARARDVFAAAAAAAREALARTPEQLQCSRDAGVVDAGGRGLCVILDAAETVSPDAARRRAPLARHPPDPGAARRSPGDRPHPDGPAYEVMYLLDAEDDAIARAARRRSPPSATASSSSAATGLWNVHVHVDDVGAAIEAGIDAGRPHRVRVTHFAEQVAEARRGRRSPRRARASSRSPPGPAWPPCSRRPERSSSPAARAGGRRPGSCSRRSPPAGPPRSCVLPNDADSVRVAEIAARTAEAGAASIRVAVIPTQAQVQGLAAIAVHEPGRTFDQDVREMTATARHARHGAVTVAARQAMTMAGPCEPGDVLGVIAGDFAVVGRRPRHGRRRRARPAARRRRRAGHPRRRARAVPTSRPAPRRTSSGRTRTSTSWCYDGGQERYPLLVCVE